jgi:predicted permease
VRGFWQDLRYGTRMLASNRGFTIVAVLTLALGIGANTAIFSILDPLLLRKLPVQNPDQLVQIAMKGPLQSDDIADYSFYERYRDENQVFSGVLALTPAQEVQAASNGRSGSATDEIVSGNYFSVLGLRPFLGRLFVPEDGYAGSANIVISFEFWKRSFGSDPAVLGKTISANGISYSIVGVTPPGFFGTRIGESADFYLAIGSRLSDAEKWRAGWVGIIARLKSHTTLDQARADVTPLFEQNVRESTVPEIEKREDMAELIITPAGRGPSDLRARFSLPAQILMGVVGLILLIACANVASLLLARGMARRREITVRLAMGAGRWRLVRQLLSESALLAAIGAAAGLLMGHWASGILIAKLSTKRFPVALDTHLNLRVFLFTVAVMALTLILCALAPALSATRADLAQDLKVQTSSSSEPSPRGWLGKMLVVAQVAFSVTVLIAAGLLARSLANLETFDAGFDRDHVLLVHLSRSAVSGSSEKVGSFYAQLLDRLEALPGVRSVSTSAFTPLSDTEVGINVVVEGYTLKPSETANDLFVGVSSGYFETMGIPLLAGRDFTEAEAQTGAPVVIVNRTMAHRFFGDSDPIGKHIQFVEGKHSPMEIVGIVADSKYNDLREKPQDFFYVARLGGQLEIRSDAPAKTLAATLRGAVSSLPGNVTIADIQTLRQQVDETLHQDYLVAGLCGVFSALALSLACVGLYGTLAFSVARRTSEIGVRMALGAAPRDIFQLVVGQGMKLTFAGLILGAAGAVASASPLASLLFQVSTFDPITLAGVCAIFVAASIAACAIPARRAMRVDPMVALRNE